MWRWGAQRMVWSALPAAGQGVPPLAVSTTRAGLPYAPQRVEAARTDQRLWLHKLRMQLELRRQPWHSGARGRSAGGASARHQRAYIAPPWTGRGCRITLGPPAGGVLLSCTRARRAACWQSFGGKISGRIGVSRGRIGGVLGACRGVDARGPWGAPEACSLSCGAKHGTVARGAEVLVARQHATSVPTSLLRGLRELSELPESSKVSPLRK